MLVVDAGEYINLLWIMFKLDIISQEDFDYYDEYDPNALKWYP
jgi:hypothetical protein